MLLSFSFVVYLCRSFGEECEAQIGTNFPDPFYHNSTENHNLVGVANVFLSALLHDVVLDYHTPIISPQVSLVYRKTST